MSIHCELLTGADGARLGIATLDAAKTLNALTLPMIEALDTRMREWANDPGVVCVLLRGNGAKAFCAGGDVRALAQACRESPGGVPPLAATFFEREYRLDHLLHTYPKPLLCWGHGHVLGGGMGLLQGANLRIVTPSTRLAMPEVSIGLYPDVGASGFLSRLPGKLGLFLGLTGAPINARDALDLGLADRFLGEGQQDTLIDELLQLNWQEVQPAAGRAAPGPRRAARAAVVAASGADRRLARCLRSGGGLACSVRLARPRRSAAGCRGRTRAAGLPVDRPSALGATAARPHLVAGPGVPDGVRHEPELLPAPGIQRRRARALDRQGPAAALALAGRRPGAGGGRPGALQPRVGGRTSAGRPGATVRPASQPLKHDATARHGL